MDTNTIGLVQRETLFLITPFAFSSSMACFFFAAYANVTCLGACFIGAPLPLFMGYVLLNELALGPIYLWKRLLGIYIMSKLLSVSQDLLNL